MTQPSWICFVSCHVFRCTPSPPCRTMRSPRIHWMNETSHFLYFYCCPTSLNPEKHQHFFLQKKKNTYALKTPHVVFLPVIFLSFLFGRSTGHKVLRSQWNVPVIIFWPRDLDLWPMTLTYKLDLDNLPLDLHAKIQVCMYVCSVGRVRWTDRHTHTHRRCQNYYIHHVRDVGCNNRALLALQDFQKTVEEVLDYRPGPKNFSVWECG